MTDRDKLIEYCAARVILRDNIFTIKSFKGEWWNCPEVIEELPVIDLGKWLEIKILRENIAGILGYSYKELNGDIYLCKNEDSYSLRNILWSAIEKVAFAAGYKQGNGYVSCDDFGLREDFSGVFFKKPYLDWLVNRHFKKSEISKKKEQLELCKKIAEIAGRNYSFSLPLDQQALRTAVMAALKSEEIAADYFTTWNLETGFQVLVNKSNQRVFNAIMLLYKAEWLILKATGLKRIPTTNKRETVVVE